MDDQMWFLVRFAQQRVEGAAKCNFANNILYLQLAIRGYVCVCTETHTGGIQK